MIKIVNNKLCIINSLNKILFLILSKEIKILLKYSYKKIIISSNIIFIYIPYKYKEYSHINNLTELHNLLYKHLNLIKIKFIQLINFKLIQYNYLLIYDQKLKLLCNYFNISLNNIIIK